jgi:outer membrane protein OmpA-like peptidoglycan-associated protein
MKKSYIVLGLALVITNLTAQNKDTKKADKLFHRLEYVEAVGEYLKLAESGKGDAYVYRQLADTYYYMYNTAQAVKWYQRILTDQKDPEVFFRYAQMLKGSGNYEEANKQMVEFARLAPNDQRAKSFSTNPNYLPQLLDLKKKYEVSYLDINSDKSDFGPFMYQDVLYFASARNPEAKIYGWNKQPFLDIYQAEYKDGKFAGISEVKELNTKYHDGPLCISADGKTAYFSSESFVSDMFSKDKERNNKHGQVNIYTATHSGGKWTNIKPLAINSGNYSCSNPSLSKDEKTLYFTSNMPGGIGGNDIWKVEVLPNGNVGTPENLGDKVNTEGDESFPFIDEKGILFFASNGKPGLGGLDIFAIDLAKGTDAVNLGKPVNTEKDDFAFTYNSAKKLGFLSSNRAGVDNIYMAQPICGVQAIVKVTDAKTGKELANAVVAILDEKGNIITKSYSTENGEVIYPVLCDKKYSVQINKEGYESGTFNIPASGDGEVIVNAPLKPIEAIITEKEVILAPIVFEFNKSNITQEAAFILDNLVQVMNNNPEMVIDVRSHTDNRGSDAYNLRLSDRRAKSTVQYVISKGIKANRINGKGYGESTPKVNCKEKCTEAEHQINRRSEFMIVKK